MQSRIQSRIQSRNDHKSAQNETCTSCSAQKRARLQLPTTLRLAFESKRFRLKCAAGMPDAASAPCRQGRASGSLQPLRELVDQSRWFSSSDLRVDVNPAQKAGCTQVRVSFAARRGRHASGKLTHLQRGRHAAALWNTAHMTGELGASTSTKMQVHTPQVVCLMYFSGAAHAAAPAETVTARHHRFHIPWGCRNPAF
jgi:hypothetical protein